MDRNEVIEIAREAGLRFHTSGSPSVAIEFVNGMVSELERAFKLVAAREREACAKVCDEAKNYPDVSPLILANRIRARGNM